MSILLRDGSKFNYNESQDIFLKKLYAPYDKICVHSLYAIKEQKYERNVT